VLALCRSSIGKNYVQGPLNAPMQVHFADTHWHMSCTFAPQKLWSRAALAITVALRLDEGIPESLRPQTSGGERCAVLRNLGGRHEQGEESDG
jgi:hypothetical protein